MYLSGRIGRLGGVLKGDMSLRRAHRVFERDPGDSRGERVGGSRRATERQGDIVG